MGTQKNCLNEMALLSTKYICLNRMVRKYLSFTLNNFAYLGLQNPVIFGCNIPNMNREYPDQTASRAISGNFGKKSLAKKGNKLLT